MEAITIKDIAKMCGVGISTVSRAINNHPDINPTTKEMIMQVIQEHNFIPNNSARNLKRTDAKVIAVLVKGITNPFFSGMIKIMEEEIKKKKYSLVLNHVEFDEDEIDVALELVKEKRLRGIVFLGGYFSPSEEKFRMLDVPFVLSTIGAMAGVMNKKAFSSVSVDDKLESKRMVEFLIQSGHRDIAIICARDTDASIGKLRLEGYEESLKENGLQIQGELLLPMLEGVEEYSMENGYQVTKKLLASGKRFTAIYAISDSLAIGACRAITEVGKKIPEDYSVVGFDGITFGDFCNPTLTTIKQPVDSMAAETIKLLFDLIGKKTSNQHKVFQAELLIRESSRKIN